MVENPKRVLFVNGLPVDLGGIERAIMDVYAGIEQDRLLIDFAVRKPQKGYFHDEIQQYVGRIIYIFDKTEHKGNKRWNFWMDLYSIYSFYRILKMEGPYCAVHIAQPLLDGFLIIAAKLAKIPVRIVHSNNTGIDDSITPGVIRKLIRKIRLFFCKRYATHIWSCSEAACIYMFGKRIFEDSRAEVVPYPVDINKFKNNPCSRAEAVRKLGLPTKTVNLINVGRYVPQKNQLFILDFMSEMIKQRQDLHLIFTGPGFLEERIKQRIQELNLEEYVTMLDSTTSIPLALAASDYFLLPSIYEGFGIVLIEAQAAGMPCIVSDVCQPEPNVGLIDYLSLEKGARYWAEYILSRIEKSEIRRVDNTRLMEYDRSNVAPRMQKVYLDGVKYREKMS